jgi:hypothetical protein
MKTSIKDITKIENVLTKSQLDKIIYYLNDNTTPWYWMKTMVIGEKQHPFFSHSAYNNCLPVSPLFDLLSPVLKILKPVSILKIQVNLVLAKECNFNSGWHTDYLYKEGKTAIFYVNDTNGSTVLKTKDGDIKNKGIKNSLLIFPMTTQHQMISQTFPEERIVINFNYFIK